ncbi:hypothetical protein QTP88_028435 [Uroleucon formosanum]
MPSHTICPIRFLAVYAQKYLHEKITSSDIPRKNIVIQSHNGLKRAHHVENSNEAVNAKKIRMNIVNTRGFVKTGTSLSNIINWYYMKNIDNLTNYSSFLETSKRDLIQLLKSLSVKHPIKYNLKLEATYDRPNVENSSENRAFKTSAKEMFMDTDIETNIDMDFANLLSEEDVYTSKGSGFTLQSIDGLLLGVYKYTPMGGSSYIPLPNEIKNKKSCNQPSKLRPTVLQVGNHSKIRFRKCQKSSG